jgi:hypothetical protein
MTISADGRSARLPEDVRRRVAAANARTLAEECPLRWPATGPAVVADGEHPTEPGHRRALFLKPTLVTLTTGGLKAERRDVQFEFAFTEGEELATYAGDVPQDVLFAMFLELGYLRRSTT